MESEYHRRLYSDTELLVTFSHELKTNINYYIDFESKICKYAQKLFGIIQMLNIIHILE